MYDFNWLASLSLYSSNLKPVSLCSHWPVKDVGHQMSNNQQTVTRNPLHYILLEATSLQRKGSKSNDHL